MINANESQINQQLLDAAQDADFYTVQTILDEHGKDLSQQTLQKAYETARYMKERYMIEAEDEFVGSRDMVTMAVKQLGRAALGLIWKKKSNTTSDPVQNAHRSARADAEEANVFLKEQHSLNIAVELAWYMQQRGFKVQYNPRSVFSRLMQRARATEMSDIATSITLTVVLCTLFVLPFFLYPLIVPGVVFALLVSGTILFGIGSNLVRILVKDELFKDIGNDLMRTTLNCPPNALCKLLIDTNPVPNSNEFLTALNQASRGSEYGDEMERILEFYAKYYNASADARAVMQMLLKHTPAPKSAEFSKLLKTDATSLSNVELKQIINDYTSLYNYALKDMPNIVNGISFEISLRSQTIIERFLGKDHGAKVIHDLRTIFAQHAAAIANENNSSEQLERLHRDWKAIMKGATIGERIFCNTIESYLQHAESYMSKLDQGLESHRHAHRTTTTFKENSSEFLNNFNREIKELSKDIGTIKISISNNDKEWQQHFIKIHSK